MFLRRSDHRRQSPAPRVIKRSRATGGGEVLTTGRPTDLFGFGGMVYTTELKGADGVVYEHRVDHWQADALDTHGELCRRLRGAVEPVT